MTEVLEAAPIGHNKPPLTPYEAITAHLDDLLTEARAWADGAEVETQAQADEIARLLEDLRLGEKAADEARINEKKPLDDQIAEIQDRYNLWIGPLKNKAPGAVPLAVQALKATLKPYLDKLEADRLAAVEAARAEAQRIADEASKARAAAPVNDLGAIEAAELLTGQADSAAKELRAVEKDKTPGLRKTFTPVITDRRACIIHYMGEQPDEFVALAQRLAEIDVRAGKRKIPGVEIKEGSKL